MDGLIIIRSVMINSANANVPKQQNFFFKTVYHRYASTVCILTMSEWLSQ